MGKTHNRKQTNNEDIPRDLLVAALGRSQLLPDSIHLFSSV
ncbi:hypothetical protein [Anabaena sp. CS-542/02]|nr:hypothetical protein [Anabaena sp. CS-542/02]MDB9447519.1 hypothetical protein [Anabaena sp. CS-542/02]